MKRVVLFYGGVSCEHIVSCVSALFIESTLHSIEYEVYPIYVSINGSWHLQNRVHKESEKYITNLCSLQVDKVGKSYLQNKDNAIYFDVIFNIIHGTGGEDGSMQGVFEFLNLPYAGCGVLSSSIAMNKYFAKMIWQSIGIPQVPYLKIDLFEWNNWSFKVLENIIKTFTYPLFVKPVSMGSSIGISKCLSPDDVTNALHTAFMYDNEVLVEQGLDVRECEISILGNYPEYKVTGVGEIICSSDFYSYDAKYIDSKSSVLKIPANNLTDQDIKTMQHLAKSAFKAIQGDGFARVDFFIDKKTGQIYLNEINTLPGFTPTSMYPKLWDYEGVRSDVLIKEILELALSKYKKKQTLKKTHS